MYQITCRVEFDSAHRLLGYDGPCANVHGHHYVAEVSVEGEKLDSLGMLMDFGELKRIVSNFVNKFWDHNLLVHFKDALVSLPHFAMTEGNPTAENMAKMLFQNTKGGLPAGVRMVGVRLFETPNCWVDYTE